MIKKATEADVEDIAEIEAGSFPDPWDRELFVEAISSNNKDVFICLSDEDITGFVVFEKVLDEGHITDLAVKKEFRRRGIASKLISYLIELAGKEGIEQIFLEVRNTNEAARKLYSGFGFKEIARRKGYYPRAGEDALVLKLTLE